MAKSKPADLQWEHDPEKHDYPAAQEYLSILTSHKTAADLVEHLKQAPVITRKAKDIVRATGITVLPADDPHVAKDLAKIAAGIKLVPILLVRHLPLGATIADGYHRVCAVYHYDYDAVVACKLV